MMREGFIHTQAGDVLLTKSRSDAAAFAAQGGCVIGLCPEEELRTIEFPEAFVLAGEEEALSQHFVEKTACHFYGKPAVVAVTERLVIRESTGEDYPVLYDLLKQCDETGGRIFADGFDLDEIGTREAFLQYVNACYRFFGFGMWTVLEGEDRVIGWCGLYPKKDEGEEGFHVEIGYAIAPSLQGKGYGFEACSAIIVYAEEELGLAKKDIVVRTDEGNAAAIALAVKLGLTLRTENG